MSTLHTDIPLADAEDLGALGVVFLKHFLSQVLAGRAGQGTEPPTNDTLCAENVLLAGLGLGIWETTDFLMAAVPSFEAFEAWVLAKNGGTLAPERVARLNATPIAGAAGDLIIWHHALPHGATPNRTARPRVVQYLNVFSSHYPVHAEWI